jgi:hypothetical protein
MPKTSPDLKTPHVSLRLRAKVIHAQKFIKDTDSILEIAVGEKKPGEFAGFLNRLVKDKTKHTLLIDHGKEKSVIDVKELAKANYSIATSVTDHADVLVVSEATPLSLTALNTYLSKTPVERPPRVVIWEHPHMNQNDNLHDSIRKRVESLGLACHVRGRENVYVLGGAPEKFAYIENPPIPTLLHNATALLAVIVLAYVVYAFMSYFLSSTTPTTKSLANNPT